MALNKPVTCKYCGKKDAKDFLYMIGQVSEDRVMCHECKLKIYDNVLTKMVENYSKKETKP